MQNTVCIAIVHMKYVLMFVLHVSCVYLLLVYYVSMYIYSVYMKETKNKSRSENCQINDTYSVTKEVYTLYVPLTMYIH